MPDENIQDPQGQSSQPIASASQDVVETGVEQSSHQEDLPEKFKGKTAGEIAKSYLELEKTLGGQSASLSEVKKQLASYEALGKFIQSNPTVYRVLEEEAKKLNGENRDTTVNDPDSTRRVEDVEARQTTQGLVISKFEEDYGISKLPSEKRQQIHQKIAQELADMIDPTGEMTVADAVKKIPLNRLNMYLNKAYKNITVDDVEEAARFKAVIQARQNNDAIFSGIPDMGVNSSNISLTPDEIAMASKMGISPEKYLEQKKALNS